MLVQHSLTAQSKWGFEDYHYLDQPANSAIVPVVHFQTPKELYAELRYNYEAGQTLTLLGGKTWQGGSMISYVITPMAGFSAGMFTGFTFGVNADVGWKHLYFSSQTQQSVTTDKNNSGFFFSWSELGVEIAGQFFGGAAIQYTRQEGCTVLDPGIVAGCRIKKFSFPCYVFNPFRRDTHIVLGINYEWSFNKVNKGKHVAMSR
jgi:hypothetical protein